MMERITKSISTNPPTTVSQSMSIPDIPPGIMIPGITTAGMEAGIHPGILIGIMAGMIPGITLLIITAAGTVTDIMAAGTTTDITAAGTAGITTIIIMRPIIIQTAGVPIIPPPVLRQENILPGTEIQSGVLPYRVKEEVLSEVLPEVLPAEKEVSEVHLLQHEAVLTLLPRTVRHEQE
jgi:hypothetical protein